MELRTVKPRVQLVHKLGGKLLSHREVVESVFMGYTDGVSFMEKGAAGDGKGNTGGGQF